MDPNPELSGFAWSIQIDLNSNPGGEIQIYLDGQTMTNNLEIIQDFMDEEKSRLFCKLFQIHLPSIHLPICTVTLTLQLSGLSSLYSMDVLYKSEKSLAQHFLQALSSRVINYLISWKEKSKIYQIGIRIKTNVCGSFRFKEKCSELPEKLRIF